MTEELAAELTLSASDYVNAAQDAAAANEDLEQSSESAASGMNEAGQAGEQAANDLENVEQSAEGAEQGLLDINEAGAAAGGGMIAAGAGMQKALDDSRQWRVELNQAAVSAGKTKGEMRDLATSLSNASDPIGETSRTLSLLADRGVETDEELQTLTEDFGMLANATGTKMPRATQTAIQSMRAFGGEASDIEEHLDTFTTVSRETSLEFDEFGEVVGDVQPFIDELGLTLDDTAAYMMALEEQGVNSQRSQELFAQAVESSEGSTSKLREELGLTEEQLRAQKTEIRRSAGATQDYDQATGDAQSTMDKLRSALNDAKVQAAGLLGPTSLLPVFLQSAGGAAMVASTVSFPALATSLKGVATSAWSTVPGLSAFSGVLGIGAGSAALLVGSLLLLGGVLAALGSNFAGFRDRTIAGFVAAEVAARSFWMGLMNTGKFVINTVTGWIEGFINTFVRGFNRIIDGYNKVRERMGKEPLEGLEPSDIGTEYEIKDPSEEFNVNEELNTGMLQVSDGAQEKYGQYDSSEGFWGNIRDSGGSMFGDMGGELSDSLGLGDLFGGGSEGDSEGSAPGAGGVSKEQLMNMGMSEEQAEKIASGDFGGGDEGKSYEELMQEQKEKLEEDTEAAKEQTESAKELLDKIDSGDGGSPEDIVPDTGSGSTTRKPSTDTGRTRTISPGGGSWEVTLTNVPEIIDDNALRQLIRQIIEQMDKQSLGDQRRQGKARR